MANKVEIQIVGNNVMAVNAIDGTVKKLGTLQSKAKSSSDVMSGYFKRMAGGLGAYFSASGIFNFMQSSIEAFKEQEIANKKLDVALDRSTRGLQQYAEELQKVTAFSDELIVESMSLVGAFTNDETQIKKVIKAAMDLSAAKGIDLFSTTDKLTKAIYTHTNALQKQGIEVEGQVGSVERLNSAVTNISNLYGGQATEQAKTYTGQLEIMNNKINNQEEEIGEKLIPYYSKALGVLSDLIYEIEHFNDYNRTGAQTYSNMVLGINKLQGTTNKLIEDRLALEGQIFTQKKIDEPLTAAELEALRRKNELIRIQNEQNQLALTIMSNKNRLPARGLEDYGTGVDLIPAPSIDLTNYISAIEMQKSLIDEVTDYELTALFLRSDAAQQTFGDMAGAMMNFYQMAGEGSRTFFDMYKVFAAGEAAIAAYDAATKVFAATAFMYPFNYVAAGAALAFGLSNVGRILSMQPGGGGGGGGSRSAPSMPGGGNTTNNNQRNVNYVIHINTQGAWEGDPDKFARQIIYYIDKARGDGG